MAQRRELRSLLVRLHQRFPAAIILSHRDLSPDLNGNGSIDPDKWLKQCPCFDAIVDYEDLEPEEMI